MKGSGASRVGVWLRSVVGRERLEDSMEEEIRFHLEARAAALMAQGVPAREAARRARVEFGGVESHKDGMRSAFGVRWWDELLADVRYGSRILRTNRGFTAIAVVSLALAIGANTTIFSLANEMLYRRLGIPRAQELRLLTLRGRTPMVVHSSWGSNYIEDGIETLDMFTYPVYRQLQAETRTLGPIVGFKDLWRVNITAGGEARSGDAQLVSGNFYNALEVKPQLGRPILPSDDGEPGTGAVAVISDGLWRRAFGASPAVLGRAMNVNGTTVTIVGVNPRGFTGAQAAQASPEVFMPLSMLSNLQQVFGTENPLSSADMWWVNLMARARPGVSPELAAANLNAVFTAAVQGTMQIKKGDHVPTVVIGDGSRGLNETAREFKQPVYVLLGLTGLVLLLACANIANLMLARATAREREMSVRLALGASRSRVLRQILTESLLISGLGGVLGLLLGYLGRDVLPRLMQASWQGNQTHIDFDWRVFLFAVAITVATGLLFGLLPAWRSSRGDVNTALKEAGRASSRRRRAWTGKLIVAFQVALSTLLVASSALFVRTLVNLDHVQTGMRSEGLIEFDLAPSAKRYPGRRSVEVVDRVEQALRAVPGVQGVAFAAPALLAGSQWNNGFDVEGAPQHKYTEDEASPYLSSVGEQFLPMMGIRILRGRNFGSQDTATSPRVSIINQTIARKFFPTMDPIGRRFSMSSGPEGKTKKTFYTIIGVCADTLYSQIRQPVLPLHFELYKQNDNALGGTVVVRTDEKASALVPTLRRVVQRIDPDLPLTSVRTQREQIDADLQSERMFASLTVGFGVLALLLACVGIYGVMAYTVTQRTNEIGIRLALGAPRGQVRAMVLREATGLAVAGVAVGLGVVLGLVQLVKSMLYGLQPRDPVSLGCTAVVLFGVAMVAGWIPAARASRVEPMQALRHE